MVGSVKQINHLVHGYFLGNITTNLNSSVTAATMIAMRDTIAPTDQVRFDSFMNQHKDGNTMTSYDLIDGNVQIRIVRSKTLEILAEDSFADSGLAKQFIVEMSEAAKGIQKTRANVTERGIHGTPEPEREVVV